MKSDKLQKLEEKYIKVSEASDKQYVYHLMPEKMSGKILYCLSDLESKLPDVYKKEIKKYIGREEHLEQKIAPLKSTWKDCVIFSSIDPAMIFDLQALLGVKGWQDAAGIAYMRFNITDLPEDLCLYDDDKETYKKLSPKSYKETKSIPASTAKYFSECVENKERPLLFAGVKHVLVKGNVNIKNSVVMKYKLKRKVDE